MTFVLSLPSCNLIGFVIRATRQLIGLLNDSGWILETLVNDYCMLRRQFDGLMA